jgi:uncharacterized protein
VSVALARPAASGGAIAARDWARLGTDLDADGFAVLEGLIAPADCAALAALYDDTARFRGRIVMARHGFGQGEYQYFAYPLPEPVAHLRTALYPPLAAIANRWRAALGCEADFPADHASYLARCHRAGQTRPTPLLLRYGAGDYNCLHQDLYGAEMFPLQATVLLTPPASFSGGGFVLVEQRPRRQSRAEIVPLGQGDGVVFAVRERPVRGARGFARAVMRHGVSRVHAGRRMTLGLIFHDAA